MKKKMQIWKCLFAFLMSCLTYSCGGSSTASPPPTPAPTITSVSASCNLTTVPTGQTSRCSASVTGTGPYSSAVSWSVSNKQGGDSTVGTVSSIGLYTAPATVPTPFTVTVTATSTSDSTKSASASIIIAGKIASATEPVFAVNGGTITLPDGSSVTIPANLLSDDVTAVLTEYSVPQHALPNTLLVGSGPALYLTFTTLSSSADTHTNHRSGPMTNAGLSQLAGITFEVNIGTNLPSAQNTSNFLASFTADIGSTVFQAASAAWNVSTKTATVLVSENCFSVINNTLNAATPLEIGIFPVELALRSASSPRPGLLFLNGAEAEFVHIDPSGFPSTCPVQSPRRTLVVVHGMWSSVNETYSHLLTDKRIVNAGDYDEVFGFNYEWWNGILSNGALLATDLDKIVNCSNGKPIDILAHSEGVPVSMVAIEHVQDSQQFLKNLIAVGGPAMGTPIANVFTDQLGSGRYALLTSLANWPFKEAVMPPPSFGGLSDLLNAQFAADLATDQSSSGILDGVRKGLFERNSLLNLRIISIAGSYPALGPIPASIWDPLCRGCFRVFQTEPFDGIIGLDSAFILDNKEKNAFEQGTDIPQVFPLPVFGLSHTDLTNFQSHPDELAELEIQLKSPHPPELMILASAPVTCSSTRYCDGPVGSVFTLLAQGLSPNSSVQIYKQDPTGTQDPPINVETDDSGFLRWDDLAACTETPGPHGIWIYDSVRGASNRVIEAVQAGACASGNPVPSISTLIPSSLPQGTPSQQIAIRGSGFVAASVAMLDGHSRSTSFLEPNQLAMTLTAPDLNTAGTYKISVLNPAPGGGISDPP